MLTLRVDFNDRTEDGRLVALVRLASGIPRPPRAGDAAALRDGEGNRAEGRVERIDGALAFVVPDWSTWIPVESLSRPTIGVESEDDLEPFTAPSSLATSWKRHTERDHGGEPVS